MKLAIPPQLLEPWRALRGNRRLQLGVLVILAILITEGGLRWLDRMEQQEKQLAELRSQKLRLQGQSQDKTALEAQLREIEQIRATAKARMWVVPSEAVGQARQKDWLQSIFKEIGVTPQNITLATPQAYNGTPLASADREQKAQGTLANIREFRATLIFPFSPAGLEKALAALEGGEPFVRVESLFANRGARRIELSLSMLMEIDATHTPQGAISPSNITTMARPLPSDDPKVAEIEAAVKTVMARENEWGGVRP
jgi:hypothetical protein